MHGAEVAGAGKVAPITYPIRVEKGRITEYRDLPAVYLHGGRSDLFPKTGRALDGRPARLTTSAHLSPGRGFGADDPGLTFTDSLETVPPAPQLIGAETDAENEEVRHLRVTCLEDGRPTADAKHADAGRT